jgi:hypothetical protein
MNDAYTKTTVDVGLAQRNGLAQLTMETRAAVGVKFDSAGACAK